MRLSHNPDFAKARALERDSRSVGAAVSFLMGTGGDGRIAPDPLTRRNRYGTLLSPADDEISFASTTASNISSEGFMAAARDFERLAGPLASPHAALDGWFADIRARIAMRFGCGEAEIVLAASGTDAEMIAVSIVAGLSRRPVTTVLVAPEETGSGIPRAAQACHFSDVTALGSDVRPGALVDGFQPGRVALRTIAIRTPGGQPRSSHDIDADVVAVVEAELRQGRDVLAHVLDTSKTGLAGVTRQAARHLVSRAPERVTILVDACQFRCSFEQVRTDVADGFMVAVTGSKFIAGPPFSGALLLPRAIADALAGQHAMPTGLAAYTAAHDWPPRLRQRLGFAWPVNLGLGLRWVSSLAHLDRYFHVPETQARAIGKGFVGLVLSRLGKASGLLVHPDDKARLDQSAIVPMTVTASDGSYASLAYCQDVHKRLREPDLGPVCHIGQAVCLGDRTVLRVAPSATDIVEVWGNIGKGQSLEEALEPVSRRLDAVFAKLARLMDSDRRADG